MLILPSQLEVSGPGVDVSNQPDELSVNLSDPVRDFEYARNAVTLTYDLSGVEHARLTFSALEYGDEPHAPPAGPFGDDVNFDGVAISVDGANWHEVQDLRHLRSDKFTAYDVDLDAAVASMDLTYNGAFRVRFCQYDDNPAPMDGFTIQSIELNADGRPPILHLAMDDNADTPTVTDSAAGGHHQVFVDPGGNPNTSAHSVPGRVGTALQFDGGGDHIDLGAVIDSVLGQSKDFSFAFWWTRGENNNENFMYVLYKLADNGTLLVVNGFYAPTSQPYTQFYVYRSNTPEDRTLFPHNPSGYGWNHYVFQRKGARLELWANGALMKADSTPGNSRDFSGSGSFGLVGLGASGARGAMDDFRVYDRALFPSEIHALANPA